MGIILPYRHGHPQAWAKGTFAHACKCFCEFLTNKSCQKYQYTKYLCIIFKTCRQLLGVLSQIPLGLFSWTLFPKAPDISTRGNNSACFHASGSGKNFVFLRLLLQLKVRANLIDRFGSSGCNGIVAVSAFTAQELAHVTRGKRTLIIFLVQLAEPIVLPVKRCMFMC